MGEDEEIDMIECNLYHMYKLPCKSFFAKLFCSTNLVSFTYCSPHGTREDHVFKGLPKTLKNLKFEGLNCGNDDVLNMVESLDALEALDLRDLKIDETLFHSERGMKLFKQLKALGDDIYLLVLFFFSSNIAGMSKQRMFRAERFVEWMISLKEKLALRTLAFGISTEQDFFILIRQLRSAFPYCNIYQQVERRLKPRDLL